MVRFDLGGTGNKSLCWVALRIFSGTSGGRRSDPTRQVPL